MSVAHYSCLFVDAALLCQREVPGRKSVVLGPACCCQSVATATLAWLAAAKEGQGAACVHTVEFLCKSLRYCIDCSKSTIFCWLMG